MAWGASIPSAPAGKGGGTKAPAGARQGAAVRALGGPRYLNKASGKMETGQQIKNFKAPGRPPHVGGGKPGGHGGGHGGGAKPQGPPNLGEGLLNNQQREGLEHNYEKTARSGIEAGYKPLLNQVDQNELGASERYGESSKASSGLLGSLSAQQEASAKTFENQAAENALQQGKAVETTGQQLGSQTAGYVAPELRAELNAEAQREVGAGAAGNTFAQNSAQASGNLLAGLRGAAALRATEGQGKITGTFQKQASGLREKEAGKIGEIPGLASSYGQKAAEGYEKAFALNQGLGIKAGALHNSERATGSKVASERSAEARAKEKAALEAGKFNFSKWSKEHELAIKGLSVAEKKRYDEAQTRIKEHAATGKTVSPAEGRKYMTKVSELEGAVLSKLGPRTKGATGWTHQGQEAVRKELGEKYGADQVSAAMNLAVYGRLGPADQAVAISYGLTPNLRPGWFKGK